MCKQLISLFEVWDSTGYKKKAGERMSTPGKEKKKNLFWFYAHKNNVHIKVKIICSLWF